MVYTLVIAILTIAHGITVLHALGYAFDVSVVMFICIGLLFVILGNFMGKLRSTFTIGIRTPWTLSSEECWNKTHRFNGRWMIVLGLWLIIGTVFSFNRWVLLSGFIGGEITLLAATYLFSYLVWRKEMKTKVT